MNKRIVKISYFEVVLNTIKEIFNCKKTEREIVITKCIEVVETFLSVENLCKMSFDNIFFKEYFKIQSLGNENINQQSNSNSNQTLE